MKLPAISLIGAWRRHWPEYLLEAAELGLFMISACIFALLLFHPDSAAHGTIESGWIRRLLMGAAMGLTAIALIYSPLGRRSGAHMNPAVTLAFLRLGRIAPADAAWYVLLQTAGGTAGMLLMSILAGRVLADASVRYVATVPASTAVPGLVIAWATEFAMSFVLMTVVLCTSNRRATAPFTGLFAGTLVATYILVASPLSGMSINPARTVASAIVGQVWTAWWIYLTAPPAAMLLAAQLYLVVAGAKRVFCAKLYHDETSRCIFRCRAHELRNAPSAARETGVGSSSSAAAITG